MAKRKLIHFLKDKGKTEEAHFVMERIISDMAMEAVVEPIEKAVKRNAGLNPAVDLAKVNPAVVLGELREQMTDVDFMEALIAGLTTVVDLTRMDLLKKTKDKPTAETKDIKTKYNKMVDVLQKSISIQLEDLKV